MINKICGHCFKPFTTIYETQIYCDNNCKKNSNHMKRRLRDANWASMRKEKRRIRMIRYRKRCKEEGKCPRCGKENDRLELGLQTCTNCSEQR